MHNRDVCRLAAIAVLFFTLFPHNLSAQTRDIILSASTEYYARAKTSHDSYENYIKKKRLCPKKESNNKKKSSVTKKSRNAAKTVAGKKKAATGAKAKIYTVRRGDTLLSIARRYAVPVEALVSCNKLKNKNTIKIGMKITIPLQTVRPASVQTRTKPNRETKPLNSPPFQWPVHHVISYHNDGLDGVKPIGIVITGKRGSSVLSSASGTVKKIGSMRGFGKYIVIVHKGRYSTVYANLDQITVSSGDRVGAGNAIGRINSSNQKLHFQIDLEGKPENPLKYLPDSI